jgi:hypothetical protein
VIMAYGVDVPTEVGCVYSKKIPSEDSDAGTTAKSNTEGGLPYLEDHTLGGASRTIFRGERRHQNEYLGCVYRENGQARDTT